MNAADITLGQQVRATLYMLEHVSLDPGEIARMRLDLTTGTVALRFFKYSNPTAVFELPLDGRELAGVRSAFEANASGPMVDAAKRVLASRSWNSAETDSEATAPGVGSWNELLEAIAANERAATVEGDIRGTLYMLENIPVHPRGAAAMRADLENGFVALDFFGYSNPVRSLQLPLASTGLARIRLAFEANTSGPLFDAAQRVLKWRGRNLLRYRSEEGPLRMIREAVVWPAVVGTHARYMWTAQQAAQVDAIQSKQSSEIAAKSHEVRERRNSRLAVLEAATTRGILSWHQVLAAVAEVSGLGPQPTAVSKPLSTPHETDEQPVLADRPRG